jgi:hypothetical protein
MRGAGGPPDIQQMLDRVPVIALADLNNGDALIVSSTVGNDPTKLTAITVMAGVEPMLAAAPERSTNFGGWNLGGDIGLPQ